jgi:hypothetical protein
LEQNPAPVTGGRVPNSPFFINTFSLAASIKRQSQSKYIIMAKENLSELSTEDLIKKKKSTTFSTGLLGGVLIALLVITILQTVNKGATALLAIPFALLPILIKSYNQVKAMDRELKSRNAS